MRAFKDRFNPKVKKNLVPFGMLFTQIMRNVGVNVSGMEASARASQLKGVTFLKMGIAKKSQNMLRNTSRRNPRKNHNLW